MMLIVQEIWLNQSRLRERERESDIGPIKLINSHTMLILRDPCLLLLRFFLYIYITSSLSSGSINELLVYVIN